MSDPRRGALRRLARVERQAATAEAALPWGAIELELSPEDSEVFDAALRAQGFDPTDEGPSHLDSGDGSSDYHLAVLRAMGVVKRRRLLGADFETVEFDSTVSPDRADPR